jgi:hypothetical protein
MQVDEHTEFANERRDNIGDNIEEALSYVPWTVSDGSSIDENEHCMICRRILKPQGGAIIYESDGGYIDKKCYKKYIEKHNHKRKR